MNMINQNSLRIYTQKTYNHKIIISLKREREKNLINELMMSQIFIMIKMSSFFRILHKKPCLNHSEWITAISKTVSSI